MTEKKDTSLIDPVNPALTPYVPNSQEDRYFCCSSVSVSMPIFIASSFIFAISLSMFSGVRCTAFSNSPATLARCSAASAWLANDMSMTAAG